MKPKTVSRSASEDALVDALADRLHVHSGDEAAAWTEVPDAITRARYHYEAEARGDDDVRVTVVD